MQLLLQQMQLLQIGVLLMLRRRLGARRGELRGEHFAGGVDKRVEFKQKRLSAGRRRVGLLRTEQGGDFRLDERDDKVHR
jgi:hypothetical protein